MKRTLSGMLIVVLTLALGTGGCATVKKKFTRKKDQVETRPVVYTEKDYVKPYTNEYYYTNNFNLWKVWQEQLVQSDGANGKTLERAAQEAVSRLKAMQEYLEEPKKSELGEVIAQIEGATSNIDREGAAALTGQSKFVLEKTLRVIKGKFYTDDVKPWLKKDEIKL